MVRIPGWTTTKSDRPSDLIFHPSNNFQFEPGRWRCKPTVQWDYFAAWRIPYEDYPAAVEHSTVLGVWELWVKWLKNSLKDAWTHIRCLSEPVRWLSLQVSQKHRTHLPCHSNLRKNFRIYVRASRNGRQTVSIRIRTGAETGHFFTFGVKELRKEDFDQAFNFLIARKPPAMIIQAPRSSFCVIESI